MPPGAGGGDGDVGGVAALILAAGAGTRYGPAPKLLAELDGQPLLDHVVVAARAARSVDRIVVVLGAHADAVRGGADLAGAEVVECAQWEQGQAASLRCGLGALTGAGRVLVLVGDQPRVSAAAIDRLAGEPPGSRAAYGGSPGHPAVLDGALMAKAATLEGDRGLRDVVAWRLVECGDVADGRDVDVRSDLEALRGER